MLRKIFFLLLLFTQSGYCDITPENSHRVNKCVKFTNIEKYPDYFLMAYVEGVNGQKNDLYLIKPDECLDKGYKFNRLLIFAVKKNYLQTKDVESIDWKNDSNVIRTDLTIDCEGGYLENSNPIVSIQEFYEIIGINDTVCSIYKKAEIKKFNNGQPDSVVSFQYFKGKQKQQDSVLQQESLVEIYPAVYIVSFLKALMLTIFIELLVLFFFFKTIYKSLQVDNKKLFFIGILASLTTLPYLWFVIPVFLKWSISYIVFGELFVVIIESILLGIFLKINFRIALLVSFFMNLVSFLVGITLNILSAYLIR